MAHSKFYDDELEALIRSWSLTSPDYDIGVVLPIRPSENEEQNSFESDTSFTVELSPLEMRCGRDLLERVSDNLVNFVLLCRSKVSLEEQRAFDENLPSACATLVENILNEKLSIKLPSTLQDFRGSGRDERCSRPDSVDSADFLTSSMKIFLTSGPINEKYRDCSPTETILTDFSPSFEDLSGLTSAFRSKTPGPLDQPLLDIPDSPTEDLGPRPEELLEERYLGLGARPKRFRSRKWMKKKKSDEFI
jgi:hypothetical protein